eukprot:TRINITY_DN26099_c0_g1_i1.p1 TRINITY_DN26099_c0_g1~~TRINITY_DN26099_c0_g1_i1.p1  ORF type:complete len:378 (+),score=59.00 TRINITY_DN26099_c0_g1_i1:136-1269(+)
MWVKSGLQVVTSILVIGSEAMRQTSEQSCTPASEEELRVPEQEVELVFVRHGVSLNNVFSEAGFENTRAMANVAFAAEDIGFTGAVNTRFQKGYNKVCIADQLCGGYFGFEPSSLKWEIKKASQDCLLHPDGEAGAAALHDSLRAVLPMDAFTGGFYVSPLRRTLETLLRAFGGFMHQGDLVQVQPWAHETWKSMSDYAYSGTRTAHFLARYAPRANVPRTVVQQLKHQLLMLGKWTKKWASSTPQDSTVPEPVDVEQEGSTDDRNLFPFYPKNPVGILFEGKRMLQQRMTILRRWMKTLKPGKRYVLVSHGNVGKSLFKPYAPAGTKGRMENLGVIVARFNPASADAEDAAAFFNSVQTGKDAWGCKALPGWRLDL